MDLSPEPNTITEIKSMHIASLHTPELKSQTMLSFSGCISVYPVSTAFLSDKSLFLNPFPPNKPNSQFLKEALVGGFLPSWLPAATAAAAGKTASRDRHLFAAQAISTRADWDSKGLAGS